MAGTGDSVQSVPVQAPSNSSPSTNGVSGSATATNITASSSTRRYLDLKRLEKLDLPHHPSYENAATEHRISLVEFLNNLFTEVEKISFDENVKECGIWTSEKGSVMMPPLNTGTSTSAKPIPVPVSAKKRIVTLHQDRWLARTSTHSDAHVKFEELGHLLAREHSRNEAAYTPSVFDAVELLAWSREDLQRALQKSEYRETIHGVEMSIFQMFHMMPKVAGRDFLQDRVFHALVITTQTNHADNPSELARSFTVQLPIAFESFSDTTVRQRSHVKGSGSSIIYHIPPSHEDAGLQPNDVKTSRVRRKLTEGKYASLERLTVAAKRSLAEDVGGDGAAGEGQHRWDMMTLSTAGGMTRMAPKSVQEKETLVAVAKDVEYVLTHIAELRRGNGS